MQIEEKTLKCDMRDDCAAPVAYLDNRGFIYCADHGVTRRAGGTPCRKLRPAEIARLKAGQTIARY